VSAPAHTPAPTGESVAVDARAAAVLDRALPYLGPALALVLGLAALGHRSLDTDEATTVVAARGSFSDVVERALSDDPARAGYMALLRPVVAWNDAELWVRLPSVIAAVIAAIAAYRLGRRLSGRYAGAAASLVLASSLGAVLLSRTVGPLALALAAMLLSSALFARAVDRGNVVWWAVYAVSAALLPLTHPIAASALAAQIVALVVARREVELRLAIPAVALATLESLFFLTAAVVDRADAPDGAGPLSLHDIGLGVGRALGWSPVVVGLAVWGVVVLVRRSHASGTGLWQPVLVAGLIVMPLASVLVAGVALPVYPRAALTVAAGGVALAAGVGLVSIPDRGLRLASAAAVAVVAIAALATAASEGPKEDWRAAARHVDAATTARDTVVVLPERSAAALAYYAPDLRTSRVGRGEGVTVVVAGDPALAVATARPVVSPPRYALLSEQDAGSALVLQRWVRP
jgi:mannosyltransferase